MKIRIQLALMSALASVAAHLYLTLHYYPLKFGFAAAESVCNLNAKFNCDAVAASSFSALFGIPLSIWGGITNLVLFVMMLISWLEWSDHPERFKRWTLLLAGLNLSASVVMAVISATQLTSYCIFCISLYVLSIVIFFAFKGLVHEPFWKNLALDMPEVFASAKGVLGGFIAIPVLAYLTHQIFMQNFGATQLEEVIRESLSAWTSAAKQEFVAKPSLVMGASAADAGMTLVEFADFRCSHCKHASYSLDAFVKSHPDVRFEFYTFPLDGACNEKIDSVNGISCRLAYAVYCADKEGKGWELHDTLFNIQDDVNLSKTVSELDPLLGRTITGMGLNWDSLQTCMSDSATIDAVKAQAKQGALVNVRGTPTIYVNGKQLEGGPLLPVLQAVHAQATQK